MKLKIKNNTGFTLIELLIYVSLIGFFITSVVVVSWDTIHVGQKAKAQQVVTYNTRLASKRILFEIRNASGVNSVSANSISLSNTNTALNPTVIDVSGGRVRIGYGSTGSCPTSAPCFLTSNEVVAQSLNFTNYGNGTTVNAIRFELVLKSNTSETNKEWFYSQYATGSAEVRSK